MTTPTTVQVRLKLRQDTAANWTSTNPTLLAGELGRESDTGKIKIGNGSTAWTSLAYQPFGAQITNADISATAEIAVSKLADGAARQLLQTDAAGTGVEWTSNVDIPGTLDVTGAGTFDGNVTIAGDLTVNGTTTTINTQDLLVEDKNIIIGNVTTPSDVTADGGGITLKGATDKTINWVDATDAWTSSERFSVPLGSAASPSLTFTGDENTGIYSPGADQLALSTSGSGQLFVDASGNVGIGTPSPATRLEVSRVGAAWTGAAPLAGSALFIHNGNNSSSTAAHIQISAGSASSSLINFGDEFAASRGRITYDHSSDALFFHSAGGERVRIDSSGRLGVGTSAPAAPLHVAASSNTILRLEDTTGSYCDFNYNDSGTASALVISADAGNTGADTAIRFNVDNTERLRITPTGLVGIGTSNPSKIVNAKSSTQYDGFLLSNASNTVVEIIGFSAANDNGSVLLRNGGAANVQLLASGTSYFNGGNVGIGTSAPEQELHVSGSGNNLAIFQSTSNTVCRILLRNTGATTDQVQIGSSSGDLNMFTGSTERARIDSSGKFGIGTTTPSSLLHVENSSSGAVNQLLNLVNPNSTVVGTGARLWLSGVNATNRGAHIDAIVVDGANAHDLSFSTNSGGASPTERLRIASNGALGLSGANYGASGQVLTSNGSGSAPTWQTPSGGSYARTLALS